MADGLVALVAAGFSLAQLQGFPNPQDRRPLNVVFILLQTLPLAFRRRAPFTVFAIVAAAAGVQGVLGWRGPLFAFLALNLALYSLAAYGDRRLAIGAVVVWTGLLTVRLGYLIVTTWPHVAVTDLSDVIDDYVLLAAAWSLGEGVRQRRTRAAELEDRAVRLEREREEKARQAVIQERLRIARELHDVVAHSLSVIGFRPVRPVWCSTPTPTRPGPVRRSPPSRLPRTGRWRRCAAPSASCATPSHPGPPWPRYPAWANSPASWTSSGRRGCRWT